MYKMAADRRLEYSLLSSFLLIRSARNVIRSLTSETGEVFTAAVNIKRSGFSLQRFLKTQDITGVEITSEELRGIF